MKGKLILHNGDEYEGEWAKGRLVKGKEVIYIKLINQKLRYEGNFVDGKKEGKGILYINDVMKYDGYWSNNLVIYLLNYFLINMLINYNY